MEAFPWPVSLGITGVALVALISVIAYWNKKIGDGTWIHRDMVAQLRQTDQTSNSELKETVTAQSETITELQETLRMAVQSNKITDYFFGEMLAKSPKAGDTVAEGVRNAQSD